MKIINYFASSAQVLLRKNIFGENANVFFKFLEFVAIWYFLINFSRLWLTGGN